MQSLTDVMTALSLDPFAAVRLADGKGVTFDGRTWQLAELKAALALPPSDGGQGAWASCDTCSDPGPDPIDPFG